MARARWLEATACSWAPISQNGVTHGHRDPPQPAWVVQRLGEGLSLAQNITHPHEFSQRKERRAQVEPQIDGLLVRVTTLGEMLQGQQRLFTARHRLAVGRVLGRLGTCEPAVHHGFVPHLAPQGMVRQAFDLLRDRSPTSASRASTMRP